MVPEASRKDITKSYNFIVKGLDDVVSRSSRLPNPTPTSSSILIAIQAPGLALT